MSSFFECYICNYPIPLIPDKVLRSCPKPCGATTVDHAGYYTRIIGPYNPNMQTKNAISVDEKEQKITFDVKSFQNLCPSCKKILNAVEQSVEEEVDVKVFKNYREYRTLFAPKYHGSMCLPLCYLCWYNNCDICHECGMPTNLAFSGLIGDLLLQKTTIAKQGGAHCCDKCATAAKANNEDQAVR